MSIVLELDSETAESLKRLAQDWGVSQEEAVRRAVVRATSNARQPDTQKRLEAFDSLCRSLSLDDAKTQAWKAAIRDARR